MGMEHRLAMMTAGTSGMEAGSGGIPELTGHDVAAALGYSYHNIPVERTGIHLVLAKYTDDDISIKILQKTASRLAWLLWYDLKIPGNTKRKTIKLLAKLALADFCESGTFTKADAEKMAKEIEVDNFNWRNRYSKIHHELMRTFYEMESPVMRALYMALSRE